jgi:alcohol dehydrogenase class IV
MRDSRGGLVRFDAQASFRWRDGERLVCYGRGALDGAGDLLGDGYALLTTRRALAAAPAALGERAGAVHEVPPGRVDEVAAQLRPGVDGELLVALGGGRVIDVAKALAAADPPRRVAAIPTTLSAAEMTAVHRHAAGVAPETARVRPAIVVNDPALSASQPPPALAASAANALGHALEAPLTTLANPVATLAANAAARLLADGLLQGDEPDRDRLALGALLSGYAIGAAGYGLHHVMSQTAVRLADIGHGAANAVLLPHTLPALARRAPERYADLSAALDADPVAVAAEFARRAGTERLRDAGVPAERLPALAGAAAERAELALTPPPADRDELLRAYETAW